ncbi:MAG: FKBP-type peptidyl-prolyl cis-trans isomerase [Planctomycetota bacterium]
MLPCLAAIAAGLTLLAPAPAPAEPAEAETHEHQGHDHDHTHGDAAATDGSAEAATAEETSGGETAEGEGDGFASDLERISYAIGLDIGGSFRTQDIEIDPELMAEALAAAYRAEEVRMTDEQAVAAIQSFQIAMQQKQFEAQMKAQEEAVAANTAASETFFAENKDKEGVQVTESGLQYLVTEAGDGDKAGPADSVTVHYRGKLLDGTVFDSSYDRGEPATFPIAGVIPGFAEGLQLMPAGSKGTLFIPGELAYGPNPPPGSPITPMAALVFDVEVIEVVSPPEAEPDPSELPALGD